MNRKYHIMVVAGLLGLSCIVQGMTITRSTATGLDAVRFVRTARAIEQHGLLQTIRTTGEQPLFPVSVWAVHEALQQTAGEFPSIWATSAQWAAATALVLAVVPLYLLMVRLVGSAAALAGGFFFCLLPEVARVGADGISDSTHLLFFCLALWAIGECFGGQGKRVQGSGFRVQDFKDGPTHKPVKASLPDNSSSRNVEDGRPIKGRHRMLNPEPRTLNPSVCPDAAQHSAPAARSIWLLFAGVATGVAVLARAEALMLAAALGVTLTVLSFRQRQAWTSWAAGAACFVLGWSVVLGPYLVAVDALTPPAAIARVLGRGEVVERPLVAENSADWRLADGEPMSFDVKEPSVSIRRRGYAAALVQFGEKLAKVFGYWIGVLALWGAWRLSRRQASTADRFVQVFFLLFSTVVIWFTAAEGYLATRHLLVLAVAGMGAAGYGALELGTCLAKGTSTGRALGWAVVLLAGVACLPQTLARQHHSRRGHRAAAEWLAERAGADDAVLDTRGWTGLYSGRATYAYDEAPAVLRDPHLAYLVLEERELHYDSPRSRTLRQLIESIARRVDVFPEPAVRTPDQQPVVVYRWDGDRFKRAVARATSQIKEDRHARANRGVPR